MKRKSFIRGLLKDGCVLLRHGSRHDVYLNPLTNQKQPVPRHAEIDDALANFMNQPMWRLYSLLHLVQRIDGLDRLIWEGLG